jgi:hypothetical protein
LSLLFNISSPENEGRRCRTMKELALPAFLAATIGSANSGNREISKQHAVALAKILSRQPFDVLVAVDS